MPREIKIKIDRDGKIEAEAEGFRGQACEQTINELLIGFADTEKSKHKDEYYLESESVLVDEGV